MKNDRTPGTAPDNLPRSKSLDRRARRTRAALANALMGLLREKPISSITVKEITERADVNRATFYAHYHDVYDMVTQIRTEATSLLDTTIAQHANEIKQGEFEPMLLEVFTYIEENQDLFFAFFEGNVGGADEIAQAFRDGFTAVLNVLAEDDEELRAILQANAVDLSGTWEQGTSEVSELASHQYRFAFVAGGLAVMIKSWISRSNRESTQAMAHLASEFVLSVTPQR